MNKSFLRMASALTGGAALAVGSASAVPIVNGTTNGDAYGAARSVQTVQTGFGDNFSEWNAAYASVEGGRLYLALTGNLEANFNKFEIFIDSAAGGSLVYSAGSPTQDGGRCSNMNGLVFDAGFLPDYHLFARRGNFGGDTFDLDYAVMGTPNFSQYNNLFGGTFEGSGSTGTGANSQPIEVGYNNSNTAGIIGGSDAADQNAALAVETGLELSIALSDLGNPVGDFRVLVFQNNQDHNYLSNQFLGGLQPPQGNLGGDGNGGFFGGVSVNLNNFAGDQWFTVPEPASLALLALGALALIRRRV
jgi:hypothetical protein